MADDGEIHFADREVQKCPFSSYQALRSEGRPVYRDPDTGHFQVIDYNLVKELAGDAARLSNRCGILGEIDGPYNELADRILAYPMLDVLVSGDPPDHGFHRSLIDKVFTAPRVEKMKPYLQEVIDHCIDSFIENGSVDFHAAVSIKVPVTVIADQLGVPRGDMDTFVRWSNAAVNRVNTGLDEQQMTEVLESHSELQQYISQKAREYRDNPADCILSDLVYADHDGRRLSEIELVSIVALVLVAGNETTTNAMSSVMLRLAQDAALQQRLREDLNLIPAFIEETLRLDAPIQGLFRRAKVDLHIGGVDVPAGSILMLRWGGANRDPQKFEAPESFDLGRANVRQHVTFGYGAHFCVGASLARAELKLVVEAVLRRMMNIRVSPGEDSVVNNAFYLIYGLNKLRIDFDKAP